MSDDFYATSKRMWDSAKVLFDTLDDRHVFNICYLSGYVLECYGKLLIESQLQGDARDYKHNLTDINTKIMNHLALIPSVASYCLDLRSNCNTIYQGNQKWNPVKRYKNQVGFWDSKLTAEAYIRETEIIMNMITKMKLDGVIR